MIPKHLRLACERLGVEVEQVLSWKIYPDDETIALVVDYGIAGGKKYSLSLASLESGEPTPKSTELKSTERRPADDLDALDTVDLRAMAKELGIKSYWNMRRDTLIERLRNVYGSG